MYPQELRYSAEHEWVRVEGEKARIGITHFAQKELGDVVFVELPDVGTAVRQHQGCAVVESVKAVSDVYAPLSGRVHAANAALVDRPELINEDPYGEGWIAEIEISDARELDQLMSAAQYEGFVKGA